MNLKQLKQIFQQKLNSIYPNREIQSIFKLLVEHRLQWNFTQQVLSEGDELTATDAETILNDLNELELQRPIQQIIGEAWFMDMPFRVDTNVLIPRPETEELIQLILKENQQPNLIIADVCSGSGCIAIALAANLASPKIKAYELSELAIKIAEHNHHTLVPKADITWLQQDVLQNQFILGDEDIIVSNPPYIPQNEAALMHDNVLRFEPHLALFTPNDDPLLFYREIMQQALQFGKHQAQLFVECHEQYAKGTAEMFSNGGLKEVTIIKDMQQKARIIYAVKLC
jgi:release factor glutamine methyltransferase